MGGNAKRSLGVSSNSQILFPNLFRLVHQPLFGNAEARPVLLARVLIVAQYLIFVYKKKPASAGLPTTLKHHPTIHLFTMLINKHKIIQIKYIVLKES